MTKLFDAACVSTSRPSFRKPAKPWSARTLASPAPVPKAIV